MAPEEALSRMHQAQVAVHSGYEELSSFYLLYSGGEEAFLGTSPHGDARHKFPLSGVDSADPETRKIALRPGALRPLQFGKENDAVEQLANHVGCEVHVLQKGHSKSPWHGVLKQSSGRFSIHDKHGNLLRYVLPEQVQDIHNCFIILKPLQG